MSLKQGQGSGDEDISQTMLVPCSPASLILCSHGNPSPTSCTKALAFLLPVVRSMEQSKFRQSGGVHGVTVQSLLPG